MGDINLSPILNKQKNLFLIKMNKELGQKIYNLDLGKFNWETKLFESNTKKNWWRGELDYNHIKYHLFNTLDNYSYLKLCEQSYLYEGLVLSVEPNKCKNILKTNAEGFIHDIRIFYNPLNKNKTPIIDFYINKEDYFNLDYGKTAYEELEKLINNLGYFISGKKETGDIINIVIQAKFIIDITDMVYDSNNNDGILFHITPLKNYKKIKEKGLIPKHNNYRLDNYPDRIYFYLKYQEKSLNDLCKDLSRDTMIKDWVILKIDLKTRGSYIENDKSTMYRFFDDPKSQGGVFTYENIDPLCISEYKIISL